MSCFAGILEYLSARNGQKRGGYHKLKRIRPPLYSLAEDTHLEVESDLSIGFLLDYRGNAVPPHDPERFMIYTDTSSVGSNDSSDVDWDHFSDGSDGYDTDDDHGQHGGEAILSERACSFFDDKTL